MIHKGGIRVIDVNCHVFYLICLVGANTYLFQWHDLIFSWTLIPHN